MNENKNLSEQMTEILNGLTDGQNEKAKDRKDVNEPAERIGEMGVSLSDDQLEAVAGGDNKVAQTEVFMDVIATAEAECKNCHKIFQYEYHWSGGLHDGPWNHPVPDYCPKCDPNVPHDR